MTFTYNVAGYLVDVHSFEDGSNEINVSRRVYDDHHPQGILQAEISLNELLGQSGTSRHFKDGRPIPLSIVGKILEQLVGEGWIDVPVGYKLYTLAVLEEELEALNAIEELNQ